MAESSVFHQQRGNNPESGSHQIRQGNRQQKFPSQRHQLVIPKTRQRSARPNIKEEQSANFQQKPERPLNYRYDSGKQTKRAKPQRTASNHDELNPGDPGRPHRGVVFQIHAQPQQHDSRQILQKSPTLRKRREPSAQKQNRREKRNREHVRVFRHKKHRELETGIFRVKTGNEFGFRLGQIKRNAIRLRNRRSEIAKEADNLRKYVPARNKRKVPIISGLVRNHFVEIQRPSQQHHADYGKRERHFIAYTLRRTAQPA